MELLYKKKFRIHTFEVSPRKEIRSDHLMNFLQETASDHVEKSPFATSHLLAEGKTWVLSRYHLEIHTVPKLWDEIEVATWPSGSYKLFHMRDFEVLGSQGEILAQATTSWAIIDLNTRKLVSSSKIIPEDYALPKKAITTPFSSIPMVEEIHSEKQLEVMVRDLDLNNHVNNAVYMQWAVEAIPSSTLKNIRPQSIEITYLNEALYGEKITTRLQVVSAEKNIFLHQIINSSTGAELARLQTKWKSLV